MKKLSLALGLFILTPLPTWAKHNESKLPPAASYRELTNKIRPQGKFRIYMPDGRHQEVGYNFQWGDPIYETPMVNDTHLDLSKPYVLRAFWDRIFLKDGSYLEIGGERLPLTCVFVSGADNRFDGIDSPVFPEFIIRVYLVANDFACQGPIRPGWPRTGGNKENWDTYLHYEVRDPTIMLPEDAVVRYRWNEANAVLIDEGN